MPGTPHRYALVGTGSRATMYVKAITERSGKARLVALADTNPKRIAHHTAAVEAAGQPAPAAYAAADFDKLLAETEPDTVIVTSVDATHDRVHRRRARRRLRRHHREADDHRRRARRRILDAEAKRRATVTVTFNYRYNPLHETVARAAGRRRDRRDRLGALRVAARRAARRRLLPPLAPRQGQLRRPARAQVRPPLRPGQLVARRRAGAVFANGRLFFYGDNGKRARLRPRLRPRRTAPRRPRTTRSRCAWPTTRGCGSSTSTPRPTTATCATRTSSRPASTIEDDMAVLVALRHRRHDDLPPHRVRALGGLPADGQRQPGPPRARGGRERPRQPGGADELKGAALHGIDAAPEEGRHQLTVRPFWAPPARGRPAGDYQRSGHGGADARMTAVLLRRATPTRWTAPPPPATARSPCSPASPPTAPSRPARRSTSPTCSTST